MADTIYSFSPHLGAPGRGLTGRSVHGGVTYKQRQKSAKIQVGGEGERRCGRGVCMADTIYSFSHHLGTPGRVGKDLQRSKLAVKVSAAV